MRDHFDQKEYINALEDEFEQNSNKTYAIQQRASGEVISFLLIISLLHLIVSHLFQNTKMKNILLLTILFFSSIQHCELFSQEIKGVVFLDSNDNGTKDDGERGLDGILVSDGLHVVKTNNNGEYKLDGFEKFHFVMVHSNASFRASKSYHSIQDGAGSYNFALTSKEPKETVKFVHISDTETYEFRDWMNILKDYVNEENPDFIMHTGDICYKRGLEFHSQHINSETMGTDMRYSIGNHDLVEGDYGEQFYEERFGPVYYSFEEGNVLFVSTPMLHGDHKPSYTKEQVYDWLNNLLAHFPKKKPKVFFNHDLLTRSDTFNYDVNDEKKLNLNEHNLKAWVYGHYHINHIDEHGSGGPLSICTISPGQAGINHSPSTFRIISTDREGNVSTKLRYTPIEKKITILTPRNHQIPKLRKGKIPVSVNVYHSASATKKVRYSIHPTSYSDDWHDLEKSEGWQEMDARTDWNWVADWEPIQNGIYKLKVEAVLENDYVIRKQEIFEYVENQFKLVEGRDWPGLLSSSSHDGDPSLKIETPLQMVWMNNAGGNIFMGSPIIADGKVFVGTMDDDGYENCFLVAYNSNTGEENWRYKVKGSIKNSIVLSSGNVIATDVYGYTYAINATTGNLEWEADLGISNMPSFVSGITAKDGVVYAGFGKGLSALSASSGKVLWKNTEWRGAEGASATMTVSGNTLIASSHWASLYGHDIKTGKLLWSRRDQNLRFRDGTAISMDGKIYITSRNNLFVLDEKTGQNTKYKETESNFTVSAAPLVTDELIVLATANKGLVALDKETLEAVWEYDTEPALIYTSPYTKTNEHTVESSPLLSGETVYFGASDGYFYALDLKTGKLLSKINLGAPIFSSAAISGNIIYVTDFAGNIYAFGTNR